MSKVSVVFDFDGSLATTFVGGLMFQDLVPQSSLDTARSRFISNRTSLREYQEEVFDQIPETPAQMSARAASGATVREFSKEVCDETRNSGGQVVVASAGLDFYILPVLEKSGLSDVPVHSGRVVSDKAQLPPFRYDYPSGSTNCQGDWVTCKCRVINDIRADEEQHEVIFVGDGIDADRCAARNAADTVFAKGRLYDFCQNEGIAATEFKDDFKPLLSYVREKTSPNGAQ